MSNLFQSLKNALMLRKFSISADFEEEDEEGLALVVPPSVVSEIIVRAENYDQRNDVLSTIATLHKHWREEDSVEWMLFAIARVEETYPHLIEASSLEYRSEEWTICITRAMKIANDYTDRIAQERKDL